MPFFSEIFLFLFLPITLVVYYAASKAPARRAVLLTASLIFFAWGAPTFLIHLVVGAFLDYRLSIGLARLPASRLRLRGWLLVAVLLVDLLPLFYFKYSVFTVGELNRLAGVLGLTRSIPWREVLLPLGISFITFERVSYIVDVYWEKTKPASCFSDYLLFLLFFPHAVAGPILRWSDLGPQMEKCQIDRDEILVGIFRFAGGLAKKTLVADSLAPLSDLVFSASPRALPTACLWAGVIAYAFQIYFDFSGYTDMAIGLGKMFGFRLPENFHSPFRASSVADFWRRWNMTLGSWLNRYLFVPITYGRDGRPWLGIAIVFLATGLWHGAGWTFVFFGVYHGALVTLEHLVARRPGGARIRRRLGAPLTFFFVMVGFVFFRASDLSAAFHLLGALLVPVRGNDERAMVSFLLCFSTHTIFILILAAVMALWPRMKSDVLIWGRIGYGAVFRYGFSVLMLMLSVMKLVESDYRPFIYFKF